MNAISRMSPPQFGQATAALEARASVLAAAHMPATRSDSSDAFRGSLRRQRKFGSTHPKIGQQSAHLNYPATLNSFRSCLKVIDTFRPALLLSMFRQLYDIEDRAKAFVPDDRLALRHAESRPIWERMREYLASEATMNVMPKELFGQALTSLRNQFDHLLVYLDDGLMPIDNIETEQSMKQVALCRKNWMFIGSVAAGYSAVDLRAGQKRLFRRAF